MTKAEVVKAPVKTETVNLKVYIHCEGCKKKVKKILNGLDGVDTIVVDSSLGKVKVTGTLDSKTLIKKLAKAGKHAEIWSNPQPAGGKGNQLTHPRESKENQGYDADGGNKGGGIGYNMGGGTNNGGNGNSGKKGSGGKRGAGGGGGNGGGGGGGGFGMAIGAPAPDGGDTFGVEASSKATAHRNIASRSMVTMQSGSSLESAEYATHMFSDENANNCSIM